MAGWDQAEEHSGRWWYRQMVEYVKQAVGDGAEYFNGLLRVVLSERGCYYQFHSLPEEFSGVLGKTFSYQFMGTSEALPLVALIGNLISTCRDPGTRELSVMALFAKATAMPGREEEVYALEYRAGEAGPAASGIYRAGVLPTFLKMKVRSDHAQPVLGASSGLLFFAANLTDQHLLVRIPQVSERGYDLSELPAAAAVH